MARVDDVLERLLEYAERRVAESPDLLPRALERVAGAWEALVLIEALPREEAAKWGATIGERLPLPPHEQTFTLEAAGHRPGGVVKSIAVHARDGAGLEIDGLLVLTGGLAVEWHYTPDEPWSEQGPSPFSELPEAWPPVPGPPAPPLRLADDKGTTYRPHGWSVKGSHASWRGESRFLPLPPDSAGKLTIACGDLHAEVSLRSGA